jgi:protein-disulfide isomerase
MSPVESDEEDLTRKQRREHARSQRKALEEAQAATAARKRRLAQLGSVVFVVVVAIVVILLLTGSKKTTPPKLGSSGATQTEKLVNAMLANIPQNGEALGNPAAPVTLKYFGDLECPYCRQFTVTSLPSIIQKWVRGGKLRIEYHSLETATREPEVFKTQQVAALAAGKQNKMWNFVETFYHEQGEEDSGYVTESYLQGIAKQIPGLNLSQWISDRNDAALLSQVTTDAQTANNVGFTGTPSFLIGKTGGTLSKFEDPSFTDSTAFDEEIEKILKS